MREAPFAYGLEMVARVRVDSGDGGAYFPSKSGLQFISTGCAKLDCDLGGGWPLGRVSNVVGDKSTGKTLLAIEASANFAKQYEGWVYYREAEAAFDVEYAKALGMPVDRVNFGKRTFETVEDVFEDLSKRIENCIAKKRPGLYIVDSLDALSDRAEKKLAFDAGSFGGTKPKQMGKLFRQLVKPLEEAQIHLMIISQVRDKIGLSFGDKTTRSGGRALDFYASQILYLSHLGQLHQTKKGIKRTTGVQIRAKVKKNKVGVNFREAQFNIEFGFGIDDLTASVDWLEEIGRLGDADLTAKSAATFLSSAKGFDSAEYRAECVRLAKVVRKVWRDVETSFLPKRKKY